MMERQFTTQKRCWGGISMTLVSIHLMRRKNTKRLPLSYQNQKSTRWEDGTFQSSIFHSHPRKLDNEKKRQWWNWQDQWFRNPYWFLGYVLPNYPWTWKKLQKDKGCETHTKWARNDTLTDEGDFWPRGGNKELSRKNGLAARKSILGLDVSARSKASYSIPRAASSLLSFFWKRKTSCSSCERLTLPSNIISPIMLAREHTHIYIYICTMSRKYIHDLHGAQWLQLCMLNSPMEKTKNILTFIIHHRVADHLPLTQCIKHIIHGTLLREIHEIATHYINGHFVEIPVTPNTTSAGGAHSTHTKSWDIWRRRIREGGRKGRHSMEREELNFGSLISSKYGSPRILRIISKTGRLIMLPTPIAVTTPSWIS